MKCASCGQTFMPHEIDVDRCAGCRGVVEHCYAGDCFKSDDPPMDEDCLCGCSDCLRVKEFDVEMHERIK